MISSSPRLICSASCYYLKLSLIWPQKVSKWFYVQILIYLIVAFLVLLVPIYLHLLKALKKNVDISEDLALIGAWLGLVTSILIYVSQQKNIIGLIVDISDFKKFGQPPNFIEMNDKLDFYAKIVFLYTTIGTLCYNLVKIVQMRQCRREKSDLELCGIIIPISVPFSVPDNSTLFVVGFTVLVVVLFIDKTTMLMSVQVLELTINIRLKIKHLNLMIEDCFQSENIFIPKKLQNCIVYHQAIISFSQRIGRCFTKLQFVQIVITAINCGCIENQIIRGSAVEPGALLHMLGWTTSLFVTCLAGQILMDASYLVGDTVFYSNWYKQDIIYRKNILFMIMRSQKELILPAGAINILCFSLFVSIMKMSYSILTLLS